MLPDPAAELLADPKLNKIFSAPLGELERAYDEDRAAGTLDPELEKVYDAMLEARALEEVDALSQLEPADIVKEANEGVRTGRISKQFADQVVAPLWADGENIRRARSVKEAAGGVVDSIRDVGEGSLLRGAGRTGVDMVKTLARGVYETGMGVAESLVGTAMSGAQDPNTAQAAAETALKGQLKVASGVEGAARQTAGMLGRFAQAVTPGNSKFEQDVARIFNKASGGMVPRTAEVGAKLDAGDVTSAWELALQDASGAQNNLRAEGSLASLLGVNAEALESLGIEVNADDLKAIEDSSEAVSELIEGLATGGVSLAFTPVKGTLKAGLRVTKTGQRMATLGEKIVSPFAKAAGRVESGTLSRAAETTAQEAERLAKEAARYNGILKRSRVAAGAASVKLGEYLAEAASTRAVGSGAGVLAAGVALSSGADPSEALYAGVAGTLGAKALSSQFARRATGNLLQAGGRAIQRDLPLPLPLENFRRGLIDFRADYRPFQAAAVGSGVGMAASLPFMVGAETDAEAASSLVSGAGFGATAAGGRRVVAWGSDQLTKAGAARSGAQAEMQGPLRPSAPQGVIAEADGINQRAEQELSQAGLRFVHQQREFVKKAADADYYVGSSAADMAALYRMHHKNPGDAVDFNGVFIEAKDSVTGRPVVLSKIGTSASGHEVGHAVMAAAEADPATRRLADAARVAAAKSLGAEFDPATGRVKYSSPQLDALREHYMSLDPEGREISWEYALDENIAEHASVLFSGAPAGKLGGSRGTSEAVGNLLVRFADAMVGRQVGLAETGVTTSDVLPYSPSFSLLDAVGEVIRARAMEESVDIPDASYEAVAPVVQPAPPVPVRPPAPRGTVDVGTLNPMPRSLVTPPVAPTRPATPSDTVDVGVATPVDRSLTSDRSTTPITPPQQRVVAEELGDAAETAEPEGTTPETASAPGAAPQPAPITPAGAVRGTTVQAARTNFEAPLTEAEKKLVADVQPDVALRPVAEKLISHVKALGGQRVGIPVMEMSYKDEGTGVIRSKRVAPYEVKVSSGSKVTVAAVDMDRVNYNAGLLFDWAATKGRALPYTGVSDPAFVADVQTYLRNQAEGRRGSGEPLMVGGEPSTASGEPVARLSREKEQFLSTVMGQAIPASLTPRSAAAIGRIRRTAEASGVEVLKAPAGAVEPNALRDQLRREGAPIDRIGEDPDPARRQTNPAGRNSVVMQMRLPNVQSFSVTGQSVSQPNIRAIEASFMPSSPAVPVAPETPRARASNADVQRVARSYVAKTGQPYRPHAQAIPVNEDLAKRIADFYDAAVDAPATPEVRRAYQALADETVAQWKEFQAAGYTAEPWIGEGQPYANSAEMMADVRDNKHLFYFRTEDGFGSGITPEMRASNPMLKESGVTFGSASNVPVNDVFRVVHDLVGHGAHGYEFGPKGEFNAYLEHSRMFSDAAKPALAAETLAQNSWVNYGPHLRRTDGTLPKKGEDGFVPITQRQFAEQKNTVVPADLLSETDAYAAEQTGATATPAMAEDLGTVEQQTARAEEALSNAVPKAEGVFASPPPPAPSRPVGAGPGSAEMRDYIRSTRIWMDEVDAWANTLPPVPVAFRDPQTGVVRAVTRNSRSGEKPWRSTVFDRDQTPLGHDDYAKRGEAIRAASKGLSLTPLPPSAQFMPATLERERVKGKDVQFKSKAKEGAKGGVVDLVHFSSQNLKEIDPKKSFGKGAATPTDRQGMNKVFFYVKGTAYEGPIATRPNVYEAQVDGNSLYDYNEDALGVREIVNREKRDQAIRDAGFVGYFVETPGFDAVAIFEPIKVKASLAEEVMDRRQLVNTGRAEETPADRRAFATEDRRVAREEAAAQARRAKAEQRLRASKQFKDEQARLTAEEGLEPFQFEFGERMDAWVERRLAAGDGPRFQPAGKIDSPEFKAWFGDSEVVDAEGKPLVVYHTTREPWTVFDESRSSAASVWGPAIYLATEKPWRGDASAMQLYARAENPIDLNAPLSARHAQVFKQALGRDVDAVPLISLERRWGSVAAGLKALGFDGAWHAGPGRTGRHLMVFSPSQIKSATENVGTFDPANPDIRFMPAGKIDSPEFKAWFGDWESPTKWTARHRGTPVSMVMDRGQKPKVVYHGTSKAFDTFRPRGTGTQSFGFLGSFDVDRSGIFFSEDPEAAAGFAVSRGEDGANIVPTYLNIKSPADLSTPDSTYDVLEELGLNGRRAFVSGFEAWQLFDGEAGADFVAKLKEAGYDGAEFSEYDADADRSFKVWVALDPEQVKSAISPTFDPENPARFQPRARNELASARVRAPRASAQDEQPQE